MTLIVSNFDKEATAETIRPGDPIAGDWLIEARNEQGIPEIALCADGLRFSAPTEAREILLSARIALPIEADKAGLQFSLAIQSPDPDALKAAVNNVAVLRMMGKGWRLSVFSLSGRLLQRDDRGGLRLAITLLGRSVRASRRSS